MTQPLAAPIDALAGALLRLAAGEDGEPFELAHPALVTLGQRFGLDAFELGVVLLGLTLRSRPDARLAARQLGAESPVDPALALRLWPDGSWAAFSAGAPLRAHGLIEVVPGGFALAEPTWSWLVGRFAPDARVRARATPPRAPSSLAPSHAREVATVRGAALLVICGADANTRRAIAHAAAGELGAELWHMPTRALPVEPDELAAFATAWGRDARLGRLVLLVEGDDAARIDALVTRWSGGPLWIAADAPLPGIPSLPIGPPTLAERRRAWQDVAAPDVTVPQLDALAAGFVLGVGTIRACVPNPSPAEVLWDAGRRACRGHLEDLAPRIEPRASWEDLVLPEAGQQVLRDIITHVRYRHRVQEEWGFAARSSRGQGITVLFHGPSGTGKTLAAEVIAAALRLDLYRIDLASVVSKYIGETEKHLRRLFDAAEAGGAVLLFDEAESLFGKRSEVRDSHDRYANIEVGYLLQRMESYRGLAILTTNMKDSLDAAFQRRLRFLLGFRWPDPEERLLLWTRAFPEATPLDTLDLPRLARLDLSGAHIRNIALHAAFLAAEREEKVGMRHLMRAARDEFGRLGRAVPELLGRAA